MQEELADSNSRQMYLTRKRENNHDHLTRTNFTLPQPKVDHHSHHRQLKHGENETVQLVTRTKNKYSYLRGNRPACQVFGL